MCIKITIPCILRQVSLKKCLKCLNCLKCLKLWNVLSARTILFKNRQNALILGTLGTLGILGIVFLLRHYSSLLGIIPLIIPVMLWVSIWVSKYWANKSYSLSLASRPSTSAVLMCAKSMLANHNAAISGLSNIPWI